MKTATPTTPDPISFVKSLDADTIQARLDELDAETSALRVLLRSARARENVQRRARRPALMKEGRRHE